MTIPFLYVGTPDRAPGLPLRHSSAGPRRPARHRARTFLALVGAMLALAAAGAASAGAVPVKPHWTHPPDGFIVVPASGLRHIGGGLSDLDAWTMGGKHMRQNLSDPAGWSAFSPYRTAAIGYDPINGDLVAFGIRSVLVFYWKG